MLSRITRALFSTTKPNFHKNQLSVSLTETDEESKKNQEEIDYSKEIFSYHCAALIFTGIAVAFGQNADESDPTEESKLRLEKPSM